MHGAAVHGEDQVPHPYLLDHAPVRGAPRAGAGGVSRRSGLTDGTPPVTAHGGMEWLAGVYVHALNVIHYMHDRYAYERVEMALHDRDVRRTMACGIAGLSVAADSLSAVKYAKVTPVRDGTGLATDYVVEGDYPAYGNNDERVDEIAVRLVEEFMRKVRKHPTYRNAEHTQSVLTITSNVVYGKKTGNTPDGRRAGEPFSPGANPMNGRDTHGYVASALSVAKLPYEDAEDGISLTHTVTPTAWAAPPRSGSGTSRASSTATWRATAST